jgi:hypothetical protein
MANMLVYFTPTAPPHFEPYLDPYNYYFKGPEIMVPPRSLVICIPCQNMDPNHVHNMQDCKLLTYQRGWDEVQPNDYVTVYVVDNEDMDTPLYLENGELLSTFLDYNQMYCNISIDKCVMEVNPYWPLAEDNDIDDGYESNASTMSE